jgi:hypothetical protein
VIQPLLVQSGDQTLQPGELIGTVDAVPVSPAVDRRPGDASGRPEAGLALPLQILEAIPGEGGELRQLRAGVEGGRRRPTFRCGLLRQIQQKLDLVAPFDLPGEDA